MLRRTLTAGIVMLAGAAASADTLYTIRTSDDMLVRIDTDTLTFTDVGPIGVPFDFGGLAWDGTTMWMVQGFAGSGLYTIDINTGAATFVGDHGSVDMFGLEYDPTRDALFSSESTRNTGFYELDRTDGSRTFIGDPGINLDGLSYDSSRDILVGGLAGPGDLYSIDRDTGDATLLVNDDFFNNAGMAYIPSLDEHWLIDWSGNLYAIDPTAGYSRTLLLSGLGAHDGLANITEGGDDCFFDVGCAGDVDGDGDADADDFFGYLDLFANGDECADVDGDGDADADDFFGYLDLFSLGC